ncbi:MAG: hydrogenase expression/formation protein HypE [Thermoplasmata archaeon]|nr:hydrogenase expression/formation protein HypE [Thermoplasmata archaeon]
MSKILMSHGAGGEKMKQLLDTFILPKLRSDIGDVPLSALDDSGIIDDIVFTIDGHTVKPIFFPGGDIGSLAVAGTVNDIAVMGARPVALALSLVIEEGLDGQDLEKIMDSISLASEKAGVPVMAGDTKVVERGAADKIVVTTAGIGVRSNALDINIKKLKKIRHTHIRWLRDSNLQPGDKIIVSGTVGDHGIAVLSCREGYGFESEILSDVCSLNSMIEKALHVGGIVSMKDPTRGGLANTLNEFAEKSGVGIEIDEEFIPLNPAVIIACGLLGLDPLEIGNEGKVVIGVAPEKADEVLACLRATEEGKNAALIGQASSEIKGVVMKTSVGGRRVVEPPIGDPIPRIC